MTMFAVTRGCDCDHNAIRDAWVAALAAAFIGQGLKLTRHVVPQLHFHGHRQTADSFANLIGLGV